MDFSITAWHSWPENPAEVPSDRIEVEFVPAMLRRRMSRLSKLVLALDHKLQGESSGVPIVFASRHGELKRTVKLLRGIATGDLMSPTAFSLSVHNSSIGLRSLVNGDTSAGTAIAAGDQTLAMALIEALGQLMAGASQVLLVYADEAPPEEYASLLGPECREQGLVVLLKRAEAATTLSLQSQVSPDEVPGDLQQQHENFCAFLEGRNDEVSLGDSNAVWKIGRSGQQG